MTLVHRVETLDPTGGAFGLGLRALAKTIRPVPFERQVQDVQMLLAKGEFARAVKQINLLNNYYTDPRQLGKLHLLAGDALYLAQKKEPSQAIPGNSRR